MGIRNRYWEKLQELRASGGIELDAQTRVVHAKSSAATSDLRRFTQTYSPTISDPDLVDFVCILVGPSVVEVDAGTGYWSSLLWQLGRRVAPYDRSPDHPGWTKVSKLDRMRSDVGFHDQDTLLCMSATGNYKSFLRALKRYNGNRVVFSGDIDPAKVPDMADELTRRWVERSRAVAYGHRQPRMVYELERITAAWNRKTQLMPQLKVGGEDA